MLTSTWTLIHRRELESMKSYNSYMTHYIFCVITFEIIMCQID